MFGTLELKSRPIKLGFLVDPKKASSIRKAIELSSTFWGGAYNPLIPVYKRAPKNWEKPFKSPKGMDIVRGYIDAFDPDILVQCTQTLPAYVSDLGLDIIQAHDLWETGNNPDKEIFPKFGVGIFEVLNYIYSEHFRYQEKCPPKIIIPKLPRAHSLFWASIFGVLPQYVTKVIESGYKKALEIKNVKVDISKLDTALKGDVYFPRRIGQYDLNFYKRSGFRNDDCVFFMDITKNLDIIDYWNLRALGRHVIPMPIQLKDEKSLRKIVISVVKASRKPLRHNAKIFNDTNFICSRNSKMEDMQAYATSLDIRPDPKDPVQEPFYSLQHWYPRIWDDWARNKDGAEADDIYHEEKDIDLSEIVDKVHIRFIHPKFIDPYFGTDGAKIANEITFRLYGADKLFAQVFPRNPGKHFNRLIGGLIAHRQEWRVGRNGLVKLVQHYERTENWTVPVAQDLFAAWMEDQGYEVKISTPGLLAKQIFSQLEGFIKPLAKEELLKLLERMNSGSEEGKELSVGELKTRLQKIGGNLYDFLLSKGIFRIGVKVQCSNCQRHSWYSLDSIKDSLTCPKCLNNFPAVGHIDQGNWCYKTTGAFSLPQYADGAYCVLFAVDFFDDQLHSLKITPALSFEAKDSKGMQLEADFGILWQESLFGEAKEGVIFGECKTFGLFKQKDYSKMKRLAKRFPGAVLAFCTMRDNLTKTEIREITKIAKTGRKYWKHEQPQNPVLILTKNELTSMFSPPTCWSDKHGAKYDRTHGMLDIADATQQIYLNLPSWHEEWQKEFEEKRKKIQEKQKEINTKNLENKVE